VLRNHGARVGARTMTLVSLDKSVRADTRDETPRRQALRLSPCWWRRAPATGKASSIVVMDERLRQLVVVPVLAPDPIAYIGLAFDVDDIGRARAESADRASRCRS
jgi:adenylate cyclase